MALAIKIARIAAGSGIQSQSNGMQKRDLLDLETPNPHVIPIPVRNWY